MDNSASDQEQIVQVLKDAQFNRLSNPFMKEVLTLLEIPTVMDDPNKIKIISKRISLLYKRYKECFSSQYINHANFININPGAKQFLRNCFKYLHQRKNRKQFNKTSLVDQTNKPHNLSLYQHTNTRGQQSNRRQFKGQSESINQPHNRNLPFKDKDRDKNFSNLNYTHSLTMNHNSDQVLGQIMKQMIDQMGSGKDRQPMGCIPPTQKQSRISVNTSTNPINHKNNQNIQLSNNTLYNTNILPQLETIQQIIQFQMKLYEMFKNNMPEIFYSVNNYSNCYSQPHQISQADVRMYKLPSSNKHKSSIEGHILAEEDYNQQPRRRPSVNSHPTAQNQPYADRNYNQGLRLQGVIKSSTDKTCERHSQDLIAHSHLPSISRPGLSSFSWIENSHAGYNPRLQRGYLQMDQQIGSNFSGFKSLENEFIYNDSFKRHHLSHKNLGFIFGQPHYNFGQNRNNTNEGVGEESNPRQYNDNDKGIDRQIVIQQHDSNSSSGNQKQVLAQNQGQQKSQSINDSLLVSKLQKTTLLLYPNELQNYSASNRQSAQRHSQNIIEKIENMEKMENIESMEKIDQQKQETFFDPQFWKCRCKGHKNLTQFRTCHICFYNYHLSCLKMQPISTKSDFLCHICSLTTLNQSHCVKEMVAYQYIQRIEKEKRFVLKISIESINKIWDLESEDIDVQARCGRLDGKQIFDQFWPDNCLVKINNNPIAIFKALSHSSSLKKRKDHAVSLGSMLKKYNKLKNVILELTILPAKDLDKKTTRINNHYEFIIGVFVVKKYTTQQLYTKIINQLQSNPYKQNCSRQLLNLNSDELFFQEVKVNLIDPYTKNVIETPVKGRKCIHGQCFDLKFYLSFMQATKNPTWKCPICGCICRQFVLDQDVKNIIKKLEQKNRQIPSQIVFYYKNGIFMYRYGSVSEQVDKQYQNSSQQPQKNTKPVKQIKQNAQFASSLNSYPIGQTGQFWKESISEFRQPVNYLLPKAKYNASEDRNQGTNNQSSFNRPAH